MVEHNPAQSDDAERIDRLLECEPAPASPELRSRLRERTQRAVRRRRRARRVRMVALMAACYLAGMLTTSYWWLKQRWAANPASLPPSAQHQVVQQRPAPAPRPPVRAQPAAPQLAPVPTPAPVLERWAWLAEADERARLLREAGDRYLEAGDLAAALRCYRRSLEADAAGRTDQAGVRNWLYLALKTAKKRERQDECAYQ